MRNIPGTVCLMGAMFILCGCMNQEAGSVNETIQENNERIGTTAETNSEITEVDDMDSARALLSEQWDIQQPGALPEGFSVQGYYVYDRNMVEIRYHDEEGHELYYGTSNRSGDISGSAQQYEQNDTIEAGAFSDIWLKGSNTLWNVAVWVKDGISYSITDENGLTTQELTAMIESLSSE